MNEVFNEWLRIKMLFYIDVILFFNINLGFFFMNMVLCCVKCFYLDLNKFIC